MNRIIKEFPNYRISDKGQITNLDGSIKSYSTCKLGYGHVCFTENKKSKSILLHRLVLTAFRGDCPDGMEGCHNDGNPSNNNLENLRWDTRKNNHADKKKHGTWPGGENNNASKLKNKQVLEIRADHKKGMSTYKIATKYKMAQSVIWYIVNRVAWKHI